MKKIEKKELSKRKTRMGEKSGQAGFTLLEICVVAGFLGLLLLVAFLQKINVDAMSRDNERKIAINAMYYALEEGFYAENGYYPASISAENLTMMDPALFTDPEGVLLGDTDSDYVYIAANCNSENQCQEYSLRSRMEKEDSYVKRNRSH